jgi:hypothetical protein
MLSVSSRVKLPELPEARMETRKPMKDSPRKIAQPRITAAHYMQTFKIMAERKKGVNAQKTAKVDNSLGELSESKMTLNARIEQNGYELLPQSGNQIAG